MDLLEMILKEEVIVEEIVLKGTNSIYIPMKNFCKYYLYF